ncbi:hypothetical protein CALCODRAFT_534033 [Calocera cornea HHB12733]|uniref:Uncharacterized protein n=1 Tax=Calocera cornea HHB12733 TaxID=1353952 RepID=A0A165CRK5_9BASI|nr:hypothetical protein CALCODRAFT_534033 [Calocera cornea HHB12733]
MALSELAINRDFLSPQPTNAPGRHASSRPAGHLMAARNDIEQLLTSKAAFPAQSTPRRFPPDVFASPTLARTASTASPPDGHGACLGSNDLSRSALPKTHAQKNQFVPETPHAWVGASMASYGTPIQESCAPLVRDQFLPFNMAGQPLGANDSGSSLAEADMAGVFDPEELAELMVHFEQPATSSIPNESADYANLLASLPPFFALANNMEADSAAGGQPAGPGDESRTQDQNIDSGWPAGGQDDDNGFSGPPLPPNPSSSSSSSGSQHSPAKSTLPPSPKSSSSDSKSRSPFSGALFAAQERDHQLWDHNLDSSFDSDEDDGQEILDLYKKRAEAMKQAHSQANNPPPTVVDRRRPDNLKTAREDIQNTGKRLLHEMKLLSNPTATQPASCPWRASWLKLAIKHKCTLFNWPDDAPWPHELPAQLQNSVDQDIVPIWRGFTTQTVEQAPHVKLWSKEAILDPLGENPPLIMRCNGDTWRYRDEESRVQESEDDEGGGPTGQLARLTPKRRKEAGRLSKQVKGKRDPARLPPPRGLSEESRSALPRQPTQVRDEAGHSRPNGQPSGPPSRAQASTLKRKMSDIPESSDEELPSARTVAHREPGAIEEPELARVRADSGFTTGVGHRPPGPQHQSHRATSRPASRPIDLADQPLPNRDLPHDYLSRNEQHGVVLPTSTSREHAHAYGPIKPIILPCRLAIELDMHFLLLHIMLRQGELRVLVLHHEGGYQLPRPRPMPTVDNIGEPAGAYWPRDGGGVMGGPRYGESSSRDAREINPRRIISHR